MRESSFWSGTFARALSLYAIAIFAVMWVGFVIALAVNREWLDVLWDWAQALPLVPRILFWVVLLPIMVGLWIWESTWSPLARLVGLAGLVAWTLVAVSSFVRNMR